MESLPLLKGRYQVGDLLGLGAFGEVRVATDIVTREQVAVKLESRDCSHPQLRGEAEVMKVLQGKGIPRVYATGQTETHSFLVEELLGENLSQLAKKGLSRDDSVDIIQQCIRRVEFMHQMSYLHNDIKPQNFCMGLDKRTVYLTDFGLAKRFEDGKNRVHVPYRENVPFMGTASYASLNVLTGAQASRRDDIESLILISLRLLKGKLPWEKLGKARKSEKHTIIRKLKLLISLETLCSGLPHSVLTAFRYARDLKFFQQPNYDYLVQLFEECREKVEKKAARRSMGGSEFERKRSSKRTKTALAEPTAVHKHRGSARLPMQTQSFSIEHSITSRRKRWSCNLPQQPDGIDEYPDDEEISEKTIRVETLPSLRRDLLKSLATN